MVLLGALRDHHHNLIYSFLPYSLVRSLARSQYRGHVGNLKQWVLIDKLLSYQIRISKNFSMKLLESSPLYDFDKINCHTRANKERGFYSKNHFFSPTPCCIL